VNRAARQGLASGFLAQAPELLARFVQVLFRWDCFHCGAICSRPRDYHGFGLPGKYFDHIYICYTIMDETDLITTNQASAFIGCTRRSIERYRRLGWLHPIRLANGHILFVRKEVEGLRETLLNKRPKNQLVEAAQASEQKAALLSLKIDPDPIIFQPEVWAAVAEYQAKRRAR
jgi:hypothetical protein